MPVVGSTTLQPGEVSTVTIAEHPRTGPHILEVTVESNDPEEAEKKIYIRLDHNPAE